MTLLHTRAFYFMDTLGLPLEVQAEHCRQRGESISLPHFYFDALRAGWTKEKALRTIRETLEADNTYTRTEEVLAWLAK